MPADFEVGMSRSLPDDDVPLPFHHEAVIFMVGTQAICLCGVFLPVGTSKMTTGVIILAS
jgi:hypothetical protein